AEFQLLESVSVEASGPYGAEGPGSLGGGDGQRDLDCQSVLGLSGDLDHLGRHLGGDPFDAGHRAGEEAAVDDYARPHAGRHWAASRKRAAPGGSMPWRAKIALIPSMKLRSPNRLACAAMA